jgi:hypothetical protein
MPDLPRAFSVHVTPREVSHHAGSSPGIMFTAALFGGSSALVLALCSSIDVHASETLS